MVPSDHILNTWLAPVADATGIDLAVWIVAAVLVFGLVVRAVIRRLVAFVHARASHSKNPWDDVLAKALASPLEGAVWLVLAYALLALLDIGDDLRLTVSQAADTGVLVFLGWAGFGIIRETEAEMLSDSRGKRDSDDRATVKAVGQLARFALVLLLALMILQSLDISVSGLLAFGGVGGIAVGFAARDVLANFLGGLTIFMDRPFTVGDWIRSPDREIEGTVENIGWRMTRIRTFDQRPLYVPNSVFSSVSIENPSRMNNRRIYETIGIRYDDVAQMDGICKAVRAMLENHEAIDLNRTLMVNFVSCGASSLDFFIYTFTKTTDWVQYHAIKHEILMKIVDIIAEHGAEIAFPSQTLYIPQEEPTD